MALATKCPHCNTIFRVAADQLKLRGGIVRCGSCNGVFDGNAALLEQPAPRAPAAGARALPLAHPAPAPAEAEAEHSPYSLDFDTSFDPYKLLPEYAQLKPPATPPAEELKLTANWESELESELEEQSAARSEAAPAAGVNLDVEPEPPPQAELEPGPEPEAPAAPTAMPDEPADALPEDEDWSDDEANQTVRYGFLHDGRREPSFDAPHDEPEQLFAASAMADDDTTEPALDASANGADDADAATTADAAAADDDASDAAAADFDEPGFVKQGRRRQRAGKTLRALMALGSLALLLALLAQGVTTFRNQLAAQLPQLKPALASACAVLGCRVELTAQIDLLSVEPGELQTLAEHTFSYSTVLRNTGGGTQAWPHLELTLDDSNDKAVLRRVIAPRDYLPASVEPGKGFAPRSEQAVKLYFELAQLKAAGYHIAIFYP